MSPNDLMTYRKQRLEIDSPDIAFLVEGGGGWIRVEPSQDSDFPRMSQQLLRVVPNSLVLGPAQGYPKDLRIFVDLEPGTTLIPVDLEDLYENHSFWSSNGPRLINRMVVELGLLINKTIPKANVEKILTPDQSFTLDAGDAVSGLKFPLWACLEQGQARYADNPALPLLTTNLFYPLTLTSWLDIEETARVQCISTKTLFEQKKAFACVQEFMTLALFSVHEKFSDAYIKDFFQVERGIENKKKIMSKALVDAAAVLSTEKKQVPSKDMLFESMAIVCKELGSRIKSPAKQESDREKHFSDILSINQLFSRKVKLEGEWFKEDCGPLLAFQTKGNDPSCPVALIRHPGKQQYEIVSSSPKGQNPAEQNLAKQKLTAKAAASLEKTAFQLYPGLPRIPLTPKTIITYCFQGTLKDIGTIAKLGLAAALCGFGIPIAMSRIVDQVIPGGELGMLAQIIAGLILVTLGSAVFEITKNVALLRVQTKAQIKLQSAMFSHLLRLPIDFFRNFTAGDLVGRVSAVDSIRAQLSGAVMTTLISCLFGFTNLLLMFIYSWQLALAVVTLLAVTFIFIWTIARSQMKVMLKMQNIIGKLAGLELQMVTGITKLRTAGAEANIFGQWMDNFTALRKISLGIGMGTSMITVFNSLLPLISSMAAFSMFSFAGLVDKISLGSFLCFNIAMGQLTGAVAALCSTALTLIFIKPSFQRAKPILDAEPETLGALKDPGALLGGISVNQVSYAYPKTAGMALNSVSITVNPGEFVAVVGESGCGKSTLLKMMLGFYKPHSGSVLYDGKDLSRLNPIKVRQQLGVVIQNGDLVQGDLFFNIAGSDETATEEDVWKAARLARVEKDIRNMPMQLKTFVPHGGVTFSGGQQQRIMLARALFRNPKIIFLDEATSNLDNASQAGVMDSLKQMQASRFVIAHRLSTIEKADRIYVMNKGEVIEQGTYKELMATKGYFFKLASRQSI